MQEREIDLIDLVAEILSHWRMVLVAMIVGGLALGGFSYAKSVKEAEQSKALLAQANVLSQEELIQQQIESLTDVEEAAVRAVMDDEYEYRARKQYMEKSLLMRMDPMKIYRYEMEYKISVEDMGQSYVIGTLYEDLINNVALYQWIEDKTAFPTYEVKELVSVDAKSNVVILNGGQETTAGADCMKILIYQQDEKAAMQIAEAIKSYIEMNQQKLVEEYGSHELRLLTEEGAYVQESSFMDRQISYRNTLVNLQAAIAKGKAAFTPGQAIYYAMLNEAEIESDVLQGEEKKPAIVVVEPSVSAKYVILGGALFAFAVVGFIFVAYVFNNKLRVSDDVQSIYDINQLGLVVKETKKRFVVDRWIDTLRNHGRRQFTREQSLELAITAVKIAVAKNGLNSICLMGCDLQAGADEVCARMKEALEQENISVTVLDNVLYDAAAMEQLKSVTGVVLVEKAMSTLCQEIADELALTARQDIKVLGGIVVA